MTGEELKEKIRAGLSVDSIEVVDDSQAHQGHKGNAHGGGHFTVKVVSSDFQGLNALARHRRVYDLVKMAQTAEIHALSIVARTPEEEASRSK